MRRPSYYVLLCGVLVLATFSASGHLRIGTVNGRRAPTPVIVKLEPVRRDLQLQRVNGSILDTMGFLLVGADVVAGNGRASTDADGRFRIDIPRAPKAELLLSANGHRAASVRIWPDAGEPIFAALEPFAPWDEPAAPSPDGEAIPNDALVGEGLVRTDRGAPLAGALVVVTETLAMTRTDESGRYQIALPKTGATLLVHHAEGGTDDRGLAVRSAPFSSPRTSGRVPLPDLVAATALVLRATIRDGSGQPQKGVPIQVVGHGFARTIASGEGGTFRIAGLLPGQYQLRAFAFRGALGSSRTVDLRAPTTDCELQLRALPERRLQIVTASGEPVARAILATSIGGLRREVARCDDAGFVQVRAAQPEAAYDVRAGADYRPLRVVAPPESDGRLVVALP